MLLNFSESEAFVGEALVLRKIYFLILFSAGLYIGYIFFLNLNPYFY